MSNFLGGFPTFTQLPAIDGTAANVGDMAYTADDGVFWTAVQPSAPPGAAPAWSYIDSLRGATGPEGPPGVGATGPAGQMGLPGAVGPRGPQGPTGKSSFSFVQSTFSVPAIGTTILIPVTDSTWMAPGTLVFIPGAGTFTCVGTPPGPGSVNIVNSGDPNNAPVGTQISGGAVVSPASLRGPTGPQGTSGPAGPPGPQGVSGASAFSTLAQDFTIPSASGIAFLTDATPFGVGQIVYVEDGEYFSVTAVDTVAKTLTLQNQGYPGGQPPGTLIRAGNSVSGTGPQGPAGPEGAQGPQGIQGAIGVAPTGAIFMWGMPTPPGGYLLCDGSSYDRTAYGPLFAILGTTYGAVDGSHFNVPDLRGRFPIGVSATHPIGTGATSRAGEEAHVLAWAELAAHYHNASQGTHTHSDYGHQHYCSGVDHTHYAGGVDHTHGIPAGQFSHQHYDNGHSHTYTQPLHSPVGTGGQTQGGGTYAYGAENTGVGYASITANSLPGGGTGAADRGLGFYTNPADRSLQFLTALNYANISTVSAGGISIDTQGSNQAHNNMPPFQTVNFVIKT